MSPTAPLHHSALHQASASRDVTSAGALIVVACRLPVRLQRKQSGWEAVASPGGLATALRALATTRPFTWVGWPGTFVAKAERGAATEALRGCGGTQPVFLAPEEVTEFYEKASNRLLWPLLHGLPGSHTFDDSAWRTYRAVNERFAEAVAEVARPGDTIWVHDYQLALVPQLLRRLGLNCPIGFFLHVPFPSTETYRVLAVREELLHGILGADVVGFHAYDYASHFRRACLRVLGLPSEPEAVLLPTHRAHLAVLPIGIDPDEVDALCAAPAAQELREALAQRYRGIKVIAGVDRLDYTKGLPHKLRAFEELLRKRPDWRGRVVLIQVASPSRPGVPEYQRLQREVDELVGRINGQLGTLTWTPIVYINHHVPRDLLVALYEVADVALVTPVRDGMNLVALEYVAARGDRPGTLVLSEFAGAAASLAGAQRVNPHNHREVARVLADALDHEADGVQFEQMHAFVRRNTAGRWAQRFLGRLSESWKLATSPSQHLDFGTGRPAALLREARRPLLLLDYDGTLVPHTDDPGDAVPDAALLELLRALARLSDTWVVSGRPAQVLDAWLGTTGVGLVCEHGLALKRPGEAWSESPHSDIEAVRQLLDPMLAEFCRRVTGSQVERKAASVAWHYRKAEPDLGAWQALELLSTLEDRLASKPFSVLNGACVIEVRPQELTKRYAAQAILANHPEADLVLCAGDDRTDEEMFEALHHSQRAIVCQVGRQSALAPYWLPSPHALCAQLDKLRQHLRAVADVEHSPVRPDGGL